MPCLAPQLDPAASKLDLVAAELDPAMSKLDSVATELDPAMSKLDSTAVKLNLVLSKINPATPELESTAVGGRFGGCKVRFQWRWSSKFDLRQRNADSTVAQEACASMRAGERTLPAQES